MEIKELRTDYEVAFEGDIGNNKKIQWIKCSALKLDI